MAVGGGGAGAGPHTSLIGVTSLLQSLLLAFATLLGAEAGNGSLELQWSTPIFAYYVDDTKAPDLNRALLRSLADLRVADPSGKVLSNRGGWRSASDLHQRSDLTALVDVRKEIESAVARFWKAGLERTPHLKGQKAQPKLYIQSMWMNALGLGDSNIVHKHSGSLLSGVYYVRVPNLPTRRGGAAGALKFRDPRPQTSVYDDLEWLGFGAEVQVPPTEGLMLLFPSWLEHYVEPIVPPASERASWFAAVEQAAPGILGTSDTAPPESLRVVVSFNVGKRQKP